MSKSILIVDDEFGLADLMAELLTERGYDVRVTINGRVALEALAERAADLVVIDRMMPVLDGPELLRQMKQSPALASVPTILMSAVLDAKARDGSELADAFLQKPFSPDQLFRTVRSLLGEG